MADEKNIPVIDFEPFASVEEFKYAMRHGRELEIEWKGVQYGVMRYGEDDALTIYRANTPGSERVFAAMEDALDYMLGEDRFGDVLTRVNVLWRNV